MREVKRTLVEGEGRWLVEKHLLRIYWLCWVCFFQHNGTVVKTYLQTAMYACLACWGTSARPDPCTTQGFQASVSNVIILFFHICLLSNPFWNVNKCTDSQVLRVFQDQPYLQWRGPFPLLPHVYIFKLRL